MSKRTLRSSADGSRWIAPVSSVLALIVVGCSSSSDPANFSASLATASPALTLEMSPASTPADPAAPADSPLDSPPSSSAGGSEAPATTLPLGEGQPTSAPPAMSPAAMSPAAMSPAAVPPPAMPPAAMPPAGPAPNTTHGSGGVLGPANLTSTGGLSYLIDAPAGDAAHGLLVLLHGSTASNYATFIGMMRKVASEQDLIPVSVLAPNRQGWNEGNQARAAELLHRLVQEDLFPKYDIDKARVVFSGQSSGGGFLASNFIPAHARDYQGGAFLQCGAAPPNVAFLPDAETRQNFRLHFEITTGDPIWPDSYAAALAAYGKAQMQFTMDNTKPGGHCQFDQQQVILDHIGFVLNRAGAAP